MATQGKRSWLYVGSAALTGGEALKWTAAGQCDIATAQTDKFIGFAAEACAAGNVTPQNISINNQFNCPGTVQVIASAAISAGDYLTITTGGKVVTAVIKATLSESNEWVLGFANEAAAANLDVIEMVWQPQATSIT